MTCIVWDGKTLAADKRALLNGVAVTVTKIHRVNGDLVGFAGDATTGFEMVEWYRNGAMKDKLPAIQLTDNYTSLLVIRRDMNILKYERGAHPIMIDDKRFAMGSGRDFALAALELGCSAKDAVGMACRFDVYCGNGVDTLDFDGDVNIQVLGPGALTWRQFNNE